MEANIPLKAFSNDSTIFVGKEEFVIRGIVCIIFPDIFTNITYQCKEQIYYQKLNAMHLC